MRLDTDIICDLMRRMGYDQPTLTAAEIFDEMAELTPSFHGMSHERLDHTDGQYLQWPCPTKDHPRHAHYARRQVQPRSGLVLSHGLCARSGAGQNTPPC